MKQGNGLKKLCKRIKPSAISFEPFLALPSALTEVTAKYKHHRSVLGSVGISFKHLAQGRHSSRMIEPDIRQNNKRYLSVGKHCGVVLLLLQVSSFSKMQRKLPHLFFQRYSTTSQEVHVPM